MIEQHSLEVLEYKKIIEKLAEQALSEPGKTLCLELKPANSFELMRTELKETGDLVSYLILEPEFPLSSLEEIRPLLRKTRSEAVLELSELNRFVRFLDTVLAVKKRFLENKKNNHDYAVFQ